MPIHVRRKSDRSNLKSLSRPKLQASPAKQVFLPFSCAKRRITALLVSFEQQTRELLLYCTKKPRTGCRKGEIPSFYIWIDTGYAEPCTCQALPPSTCSKAPSDTRCLRRVVKRYRYWTPWFDGEISPLEEKDASHPNGRRSSDIPLAVFISLSPKPEHNTGEAADGQVVASGVRVEVHGPMARHTPPPRDQRQGLLHLKPVRKTT